MAFILGVLTLLPVQKIWQASMQCNQQFDLLNPEARCQNRKEERSEWDYEPLRQMLSETVARYEESGAVPHISLFFRDLKNGPRFGIREYEDFIPASLLKVPVMVVLLHQVDRYPELLDERLVFDRQHDKDFTIEEQSEGLQLHASYTVRELLEKMIKYSDNDSAHLLVEKINATGLQENSNTFSDLGTMKLMSGRIDNTRLISLVNIFVTLYNANYLSPKLSQFALEMLSQTTFGRGIVAGVPAGVRVAHKYGIHLVPGGESELHDCGVVYHLESPYVLCVLTAGGDVDAESSAISDISKIVYESVNRLQR